MLNYLGYSWVDMGINLDEGLKLIQKAVDLRPSDGYIVDSLGWAYYKLGRYDDAVDGAASAPSRCGRRIRSSTTIWAMPTGASAASWRRPSSGRMRATCIRSRT